MNEQSTLIPEAYPVDLAIDYPDRKLNRWTTFFRFFMVIPISIILGLLGTSIPTFAKAGITGLVSGVGMIGLCILLMILFRKKYPRWWYEWIFEITNFTYRVYSYISLLNDSYPSIEETQTVHIELPYPDASRLNRWLPLVKWFLAIPHYFILFALNIASLFVTIAMWFVILFTGKYPKGAFEFVVGVLRWELRVTAYAFLLVTDKYPPFSLS